MEANDVRLMFTIIIEICERTFFVNLKQDISQSMEVFDDKIYQLPSFIESLAAVCNQIDDNLPESSVHILEKLVILAIDSYPRLFKRYNKQLSISIARLFVAFQFGKANFASEFLSKIIYQSLIRIFSYKTNYSMQPQENAESRDNDINMEDRNDGEEKNIYNITSNDYIMLWSNLLNLTEFQELNTIGVHINEKRKLVCLIYNEIMESLIKIMKKLDLTANKIETHSEDDPTQFNLNEAKLSSNPISGLRPTRPRDFEILINLVDFAR